MSIIPSIWAGQIAMLWFEKGANKATNALQNGIREKLQSVWSEVGRES